MCVCVIAFPPLLRGQRLAQQCAPLEPNTYTRECQVNADMSTQTFNYKLVLLGESAVGKSSLVLRFVKGSFLEYSESTIGGEEFPQRANTVYAEEPSGQRPFCQQDLEVLGLCVVLCLRDWE